ncbi:hypothetical protein HY989_05630 [Candidatus Micrarchaeota archaeon]|nr:hypothetical protein [Candidatus Micrarchaeota archaeon]
MSDELDLQVAFTTAAKLVGKGHLQINARFYPYAGLKSTIRLRDGAINGKVSDGYNAADLKTLTGLALDLMMKLFRIRNIGETASEYLSEFKKLDGKGMYGLHESLRMRRGREREVNPYGKNYDLEKLLEKVLADNSEVFEGVGKQTIVWSKHSSRRRLAFYDSAFSQIVVSKKFDSKAYPQYFLEYLIFHELLHAKHDVKYGGRRKVHHPEFKMDEKKFPRYFEAQHLMKNGLNSPIV